MTLTEALARPTISVPEAGALFFGIGRNASYDAAKRGELPTIRIGSALRVPVAVVASQLGLTPQFSKEGGRE